MKEREYRIRALGLHNEPPPHLLSEILSTVSQPLQELFYRELYCTAIEVSTALYRISYKPDTYTVPAYFWRLCNWE